jgi:hypothetical protein
VDPLQRLIAIEEIKQLKARYFRGVDNKDAKLLAGCFSPDAVADYRGCTTDPRNGINAVPTATVEVLNGCDEIAAAVIGAVSKLQTVHHGCCPEITVTSDDTASGIWPMVDHLRMPDNDPVAEMDGWGYYIETYRRIDRVWKIQTLRLPRLRLDVTPRV